MSHIFTYLLFKPLTIIVPQLFDKQPLMQRKNFRITEKIVINISGLILNNAMLTLSN